MKAKLVILDGVRRGAGKSTARGAGKSTVCAILKVNYCDSPYRVSTRSISNL
jgi:hypothetical protein